MTKLLADRFPKTNFEAVETPRSHYIEATSSEEAGAIIQIFSSFKNADELLFKVNPSVANGITIGYLDTKKILNDAEFGEVMGLIRIKTKPGKSWEGFTPIMEAIVEESEGESPPPSASAGAVAASGLVQNHKGRQ